MGNQGPPEVQQNEIEEVRNAVVAAVDEDTGELRQILTNDGVLQVLVTTEDGQQLTDALQAVSDDQLRVDFENDNVGLLKAADQPLDVSGAEVDVDLATQSLAQLSADIEQIGGQAQSAVDVASAIDQIEDALASVGGDQLRTDIQTNNAGLLESADQPLDVSGAEVDVDLATQTLAQLVAALELEDAAGTGTYGGVRRRSNAIQTSLENDQVGLLQTTDQPFDVSGATVTVTDDGAFTISGQPLDVSAATVTVTDDGSFTLAGQPLDVSATTVPVEQQTPVQVEDAGGANIDPLARQDAAPVTGSTTTNATNVALVLGDYRKDVDWFVDTSGAATLTVEVRVAGGTWRLLDTIDYSSATESVEQYNTSFAEIRARVDTALNTLEGSSKGV